MSRDPESAMVSVRVDAALKERLESLAASDSRTLANYVRVVLERHVQQLDAGRESEKGEAA